MSYGVRLRVWGSYACFTRPEMKVERVSYDVITPSAARGILTAIYWKPEMRWVVDRIHVLKPIRFTSIRRNEVDSVVSTALVTQAMRGGEPSLGITIEDSRQQRAALVLRDVDYVIEAHFELAEASDGNSAKHAEMFRRRAEKGQFFHAPFLGTREFACAFELIAGDVPISPIQEDRDLGWMLYDIDFENESSPVFMRAWLKEGIVDVARAREEGLAR
jgi:CRISPR-associated protein Cas5d